MKKYSIYSCFIALVFVACGVDEMLQQDLLNQTLYQYEIENDQFPLPNIPDNNVLTDERIALGKQLFFDNRLSRNFNFSCASCHKPELAFSDTILVPPGDMILIGKRGSPTLANVAWHPYFFKEGGSPTLETQVQGPIENPEEMDFTFPELIERLSKIESYQQQAQLAYKRELDAFVITRALGAFQRTLVSSNSTYDQYLAGKTSLNQTELLGKDLFFGKANCSSCHSGFDFTEYEFENNGLYAQFEDVGLFRVSSDSSDIGKFKIPTLRNIELTAPYMHNGSLKTLTEVIDHYNSGGTNHPNKSELIIPLHLSAEEKASLKAFLKTLTDQSFINNPAYRIE